MSRCRPGEIPLPDAPFPYAQVRFSVEGVAGLGEEHADVSLVVRRMGDQVAEEGGRGRLEPFASARLRAEALPRRPARALEAGAEAFCVGRSRLLDLGDTIQQVAAAL